MEVYKLELLKKLIINSNSDGIVITSDRRYSKIDLNNKINTFIKFGIKVIRMNRSINKEDDNRGKQIKDYLIHTKDIVDKIIILDDNDDGISSLFDDDSINVNHYYGLNEEIYKKAINLLNM